MNKKACELCMVDSVFNDPAGIDNYSTSKDILMCLLEASNIEAISNIWSQKSDSIHIKGKNERIMEFTSKTLMGVNSENLRDYYSVLGGKGGTLLYTPGIFNSAVLVQMPYSKEQLACVIMKANDPNDGKENRFAAAKQAIDAAVENFKGEANTFKDVCAKSAIVCIKPENSRDELKILYEKNPNKKIQPASMSKMLTAIVTLEHMEDLQTEVCVEKEMLDMLRCRNGNLEITISKQDNSVEEL